MRALPVADAWRRLRVWATHERGLATLLLLVVTADVAFIAVHLAAVVREVPTVALRLDMDRSYGELFEYLKLTWCVVLLGLVALADRSARPLAWAPLLGLLLADNVWTLHERAGAVLAARVGIAEPVAELGFLAVAYAVAAVPIVLTLRGARRRMLVLHRRLALGVVVLVAFGVGVDAIHYVTIVDGSRAAQHAAALVEDGGELLAITGLLAACAAAHLSGRGAVTQRERAHADDA